MISADKNTKRQLIEIKNQKDICLEGNILKLFNANNDKEFEDYLNFCKDKDKESRKKRLEITKKVQEQNTKLSSLNQQNEQIMLDLQQALKDTEDTKITLQAQNMELEAWKADSIKLAEDLKNEIATSERAKLEAEQAKMEALKAKENAENDLDILQKRTQSELISTIVRVALYIIVGVGIVTTGVYVFTMLMGKDTQVISAAWSNIFGILLTNAFSIVGTIMGIKYATENKQ